MNKSAYELLTKIEDGHAVGKDPRTLSPAELNEAGLFDAPLTLVIREKCLDCCGGSSDEVKKCTAISCSLWAYRTKKNPFRKRDITPEQRQEAADRLRKARQAKNKTSENL